MPGKASEITLRIIGGNWRSRKLSVPDQPQLRPTPDRVRETLFNWLQFEVAGLRCLELYAGSGVLGMEALSRSAQFVTFIEKSKLSADAIRANLSQFGADRATFDVLTLSADEYLAGFKNNERLAFDLVFLDPPFEDFQSFPTLIEKLVSNEVLARGGRCYVESASKVSPSMLPSEFRIVRQKRAGIVHFCLIERDR